MYKKLQRVWSHNNANYIPGFKEAFPELRGVSSEELCDRWVKLGIEFYSETTIPVGKLKRLTLPFAIALMLLMFVAIPVVFMVTGRWSYPLSEKNQILNWFRSLRLL